MSLIINGTNIPQNSAVKFSGTSLKKVICDQSTVWEALVDPIKYFPGNYDSFPGNRYSDILSGSMTSKFCSNTEWRGVACTGIVRLGANNIIIPAEAAAIEVHVYLFNCYNGGWLTYSGGRTSGQEDMPDYGTKVIRFDVSGLTTTAFYVQCSAGSGAWNRFQIDEVSFVFQ